MKILILKPSSLGDVIQAIPVLRLLKRAFPGSQIFWWLSTELRPLLDGDPDLAGIIPFDRRRWVSPRHWNETIRSILLMRAQRFDWVIDLQGLARSGFFAWIARGELLVGIEDGREGAAGFYDLRVPRPSRATHAVDWYLEVLRHLSVPVHWDFEWLPKRDAAAASVEQKWRVRGTRWILFSPGARWSNKRWPAVNFAEVLRLLARTLPDRRFAIVGGREDVELGKTIAAAVPDRCVDLAGRTSLPEMIEWVRACELMVTNDTGPMHVAAALRKPVVALFGPTDPRRTGPHGQIDEAQQARLPCVPCLKATCANPRQFECLEVLSPAAVAGRIQARCGGPA